MWYVYQNADERTQIMMDSLVLLAFASIAFISLVFWVVDKIKK